ncbi:MAG: MarR family winged helix-turn-helix transcriptional regulator [Gammaproteobacteria bacterium]|nr:MarR family winged helix-turn-helix transcriptional regulator [Gammaproteobacteria bacterium]MDH5692349.1 MarR family winged helix-turn-helix transcriptional regulator [Gammaproteobacteria bacterium]
MQEPRPETDKLLCINLQILKASHVVMKTYEDAYRPYGIKATQVPVLSLIGSREQTTIKDIADLTVTERSVLSRKLQIMEGNDWICKNSLPGTREKSYSLTKKGEELLDKVTPVRVQVQNSLLAKLSPDEAELLLGLCEKLQH